MKYTTSIEIGLPRAKLVQLVADPAHMPKWLGGLVTRSCAPPARS